MSPELDRALVVLVVSDDQDVLESTARSIALEKGAVLHVRPERNLHARKHAGVLREIVRSALRENRSRVVATNSEAILNVVGHWIADGMDLSGVVRIVVADLEDGIRESHYDKSGTLSGTWPFGYLSGHDPDNYKAWAV